MSNKSLDLLVVKSGTPKKRIFQDLSLDYSAVEPPFQAAMMAGFARNKGYGVDLLDANGQNLSFSESADKIIEANPRLVNIVVYDQHPSASTQNMTGVGMLCKEIKRRQQDMRIILTGLHPSALPERTIREEACDFVGEGEGFLTVSGLLEGNFSDKLDKIPGLWYRKDGAILSTPKAANIKDLKELEDVAWDLIPFRDKPYKAHNWQCLDDFSKRPNYASLSTSFGCPNRCSFCAIHATFGEDRVVRFFDPEWTVDQIQHLKEEYGINIFKIIDENFVLRSSHCMGVADEIVRRGLGDDINIWAYSRVDTTRGVDLGLLRRAGIKWLALGFESGNEDILRKSNKGKYTKEDMMRIREEIRGADINIIGNFIFGLPEDNKETMQETLDFAKKLRCEFYNLYCNVPWPGSDSYKEALARGIRLPETWADYAQHAYNFVPQPTDYLPAEEVLRFRDSAFDACFKDNEYLKMIETRFGLSARRHLEVMTEKKLKRKILGD